MSNYEQIKRDVCQANKEIPQHNLAIFTFGNVSVYDEQEGVVAIKPSGVAYKDLAEEDIVVLDTEGTVVEGKLRPSSDTPTHLYLYKNFKGVKGVIHTHSPYATSWAQACRDIPIYGTTHADHLPVPVPCVPLMTREEVEGDYEVETGRSIVNHFKKKDIDPIHCPMMLVAGHGPFALGKTAEEALYNGVVLEQIAFMAWLTESLNNAKELPKYYIDKHFLRKHGPEAYYGQTNNG